MPTGRLYEVVDRPLERWTFLNPESMLYLAAFADPDAAAQYGERNGYDMGEPPRIKGRTIDEAQPPLETKTPEITTNSPLPNLRRSASAQEDAKKQAEKPTVAPIRMGINLGNR